LLRLSTLLSASLLRNSWIRIIVPEVFQFVDIYQPPGWLTINHINGAFFQSGLGYERRPSKFKEYVEIGEVLLRIDIAGEITADELFISVNFVLAV
jgi:hypothetical protein